MADLGQSQAAASTLIAGVIQRLETSRAAEVQPALTSVHPGALVQVEFMMIHAACQSLHAAGAQLTHDSVLTEIRKSEPGGVFGFACIVFEDLWQHRPSLTVTDAEFNQAVATLAAPSQPAEFTMNKGGEEQVHEFDDIDKAFAAAAMQWVMSHRPVDDEKAEPGRT